MYFECYSIIPTSSSLGAKCWHSSLVSFLHIKTVGKQCVMVDQEFWILCPRPTNGFCRGSGNTRTHGPDTSTRILRNRRGKKGGERGKLPFGFRSIVEETSTKHSTNRGHMKGQRGHKGRELAVGALQRAKGKGRWEQGVKGKVPTWPLSSFKNFFSPVRQGQGY